MKSREQCSIASIQNSAGSAVLVVRAPTEELIAYAKECRVFRELTAEERVQFELPER